MTDSLHCLEHSLLAGRVDDDVGKGAGQADQLRWQSTRPGVAERISGSWPGLSVFALIGIIAGSKHIRLTGGRAGPSPVAIAWTRTANSSKNCSLVLSPSNSTSNPQANSPSVLPAERIVERFSPSCSPPRNTTTMSVSCWVCATRGAEGRRALSSRTQAIRSHRLEPMVWMAEES